MKKFFTILLLIFIILSIMGCGQSSQEKADENTTLSDLQAMPEFKVTDINDQEVTNAIFKEYKLTLINVWATTCNPCIKELPDLQALSTEMKEHNVNILGIVGDGMHNEVDAVEILKKTEVSYINLIPNDNFINDFVSKTKVVPVSLFVNSEGKIIGDIIVGAKEKSKYKSLIEERLKLLEK